jgi:uncharacterized SAM-binding protein YcdF (DUF218 family)
MRWILRTIGVVVLAALGFASFDFLRFVDRAEKSTQVATPAAPEAIVALTGSSDARIVAAIKLSQQTHTPLLISGVHIDTRPADIARIAGVAESTIKNDVTLGYAAADTWGNGEEVADWARAHNKKRIVVVTSDYHMDRAMLELHRAMPEADFVPFAVAGSKTPPREWWRDFALARRLAEEWMKFRAATVMSGEPIAKHALPAPKGDASKPKATE